MNAEEKDLQINPVVPENVIHNTKTIADIRSLTSSIFGIAAGILGLESYSGFIFYLLGSSIVSVLMVVFIAGGKPQNYFRSASEIWTSEVFSGSSLSSFILTWTLFFGLLRA
ncbi:Rab5-interacting protein-domain-containing protein [Tuber indicum]|nr:Rab5-interacting protein-domain-containing protein [Tuber indicum]